MADMDHTERVVLAARGSLDQSFHELRQMKTPQAMFEEKQSALNIGFNHALRGHYSAQSDAEAEKLREDIKRYGVKLYQLGQDHQATLDAKNKDFEYQRVLVLENLCRHLVQDIGLDLFQKVLRDLTNNPLTNNPSDAVDHTSAPASQSTPPTADARSRVVSPIERPVRSPPTDSQTPIRTNAGSLIPGPHKHRIETEAEPYRPRKRNVPTSKWIPSLSFDDVFQKGQAETKHVIIEYPKDAGEWYIIRCLDCPLDFKDNPLVGGAAHIGSAVHGHQPRHSVKVVEKLGIPISDCNKVRAEENNIVARQAFRKQKKGPRPAHDTAVNDSRHSLRGATGIVNPTPGQVYLGYWGPAKNKWPVLILPTANLEDTSVPETLEGLPVELQHDVPPCYRHNMTTNTLEWEEGFEDGGEKVAQRHFPVMWFDDGLKSGIQVSWLPARDLEVFEMKSAKTTGVPHLRSVREYQNARAQTQSRQDEPSEMELHEGSMTQPDDEVHHTPEVDESNPPEATIVQPRSEEVNSEPMSVVNDGVTSIETGGNLNDNLQRKSIDIISILCSTPASESRELHPDEAAGPSSSELYRTSSAPDADPETTTSNTGVDNPDQPTQVDTVFEATMTRHAWVDELAELENACDRLATIAQNGLNHNLGRSDFVTPWTAQQNAPREDNAAMITPSVSNSSPTFSLDNPPSHATTIPPRAEDFRNPPAVNNQNRVHQDHEPPQVDSGFHTSAIPSGYSQPQPQVNNGFVPIQPKRGNLTPEMVQEQARVWVQPRFRGQPSIQEQARLKEYARVQEERRLEKEARHKEHYRQYEQARMQEEARIRQQDDARAQQDARIQEQVNKNFVPIQPSLPPDMVQQPRVQEQPRVQASDPRHTG